MISQAYIFGSKPNYLSLYYLCTVSKIEFVYVKKEPAEIPCFKKTLLA